MIALLVAMAMSPVDRIVLNGSEVEGVYYAPANLKEKRPTVVVLHGSEGSIQFTEFTAKSLAEEGYPALAVRYFGGKDQPRNLVQVPIESLDRAMAWLAKRPEVDSKKIGVLGFSRGAELALTYGSMNNKVRAVMVVAPTSMRFQGFINLQTPTTKPAFTYQGKDLPCAVVEFKGQSLSETYAPHLMSPDTAPEWIQAEKINGPILLISGQSDLIWPSSLLTSKLVERLKNKKFKHPVEWHDYPEAGHVLLAKLPENASEALAPTQFGGTRTGVFKAMQDAWPRLTSFLKRSFP